MKTNFSVIIRSKNESRWIGHCIQSLIDNMNSPEIILLDNNSSDSTLEIVRNFIKDPFRTNQQNKRYTKIKIYKINEYTPGKTINFGVSKSSNDYIMILSAHCVIKKFNEENFIKNFNKQVCVFGKQIPVYKGKKISRRYIWSHFVEEKIVNMYSELEKRYFLHNAAAAYSKKILLEYPFDEYLSGKEDRYWANEIVAKKESYIYDPEFVVDHHYTINGNTWKGIG